MKPTCSFLSGATWPTGDDGREKGFGASVVGVPAELKSLGVRWGELAKWAWLGMTGGGGRERVKEGSGLRVEGVCETGRGRAEPQASRRWQKAAAVGGGSVINAEPAASSSFDSDPSQHVQARLTLERTRPGAHEGLNGSAQ
jgi:hypothetical protein